ncbi:MAG TPA: DUF3185 family protein [Flavobacterium sp.]|jgi:multisubunit Na+/H+ antiporter MnhC subunit
MDNGRKISILMVAVGAALVVYGIYRMAFPSEIIEMIGPEDQTGMYLLSVGAVLAIFGTGSIVGNKS